MVWTCFGITTADRPERSRRLRIELQQVGLPYEVLEAERPTDAGGFASAGYRGVFESHLHCLRAARAAGVDGAIVVEDDAVVVRSFPRRFPFLLRELAEIDWSIAFLGMLPESPVRRQPVHRISDHLARCDGWEIRGSHFVAVKGAALDHVIADFERRLLPDGHRISTDGIYNEIVRDLGERPLVCLPNLAQQAPSPSGITASSRPWTRLLEHDGVQRVAERVKRSAWEAMAATPPPLLERSWNAGAALRRG